jgi:quinol-cytochrome oxidoreductase complex cytochrome b subunit
MLKAYLPDRRRIQRQVLDWIEERTGLVELLYKGLYEAVPKRGAWAYALGSATLVLILNQLITGIVLTTIYVPSTTEAWASLEYIKKHDEFAQIVRGMHLYGAYVLLFVIGMHMFRTFISGSYKRPRELNWVTGVLLLLLVLGMAITGAFLPWDTAAYWTAVVTTNIPSYTPVIGHAIRAIWRGGNFVGPMTLVRTYGLHIWVIPSMLFALIGAHLYLLRRHGEFGSHVNYRGSYRNPPDVVEDVAERPQRVEPPAVHRELEPPYPALPTDDLWAAPLEVEDFYPSQTFKDGLVSLVLMAVVFGLAISYGAPLEQLATPGTVTYTPVPEWFYLPLDQLLVLTPSYLISMVLWVPLAGVLLLLGLPFFDRDAERNPLERPAIVVPAMLILVFLLALTALGSGRLFNL